MSTTEATPAERAPLSRAGIVAAAVELADEHGATWLSMRKLAAHLGYEVMSLYNHVASKGDLLDAMIDDIAGEIVEPPSDVDWKHAARLVAHSAHEALLRHPWAAGSWSRQWPGPNRWRHMEGLLRVLAGAGLPDDLADLGFHAINHHVEGFTRQELSYAALAIAEDEMRTRFANEVSADEFPHVIDHVRYHQTGERSHDGFTFVLDLILDGLERLTTR